MPTARKPPVSDLNALLKGLSKARIEFILVGGVAAVVQGAPVTTFDLDIVHRQTDANIQKLMKFLESVEAIQRRPDDKVLNPDERDLRGKGHLLLTTCFGALDILGVIEKGLGFDELLPSTVEIEFKGHNVHVLNLETMVALKRGAAIPEEQYRLQIYEETLRMKNENGDKV
jgi:predicted nucleotidyltransferase